MLAYARFAHSVKFHHQNATTQAFWQDYRYSTNPEHLKTELLFNLERMLSYSMDYIGQADFHTDVPKHLTDMYERARDENDKVNDRVVLVEMKRSLHRNAKTMDPEDLHRIRRTVQNINAKQIAWHTYHGRIQRDQWTLATVAELGLYGLVFSRVRRFCGKK